MTIPSRPAPPPPTPLSSQQQIHRQEQTNENNFQNLKNVINKLPPPPNKNNITKNYSTISGNNGAVTKTKHFPQVKMKDIPASSSWEDSIYDLNVSETKNSDSFYKKAPPPRPPPPKPISNPGVFKKPGPPQSVNILTNLFGRTKPAISKKPTTIPKPSINLQNSINQNFRNDSIRSHNNRFANQTSHLSNSNDGQLISFDSPPSSPTFTQKSNSDCVSIDSFSSDSNFSSPNNGSVSQPESGFEDDFVASPPDPWEQVADPYGTIQISSSQTNYGLLTDLKICHPVRNLNTLNKINTNKNDNQLCNGKNLLPPVASLTIPTIIRPKSPQQLLQQSKYLAPKPSMINQVKLRPTTTIKFNTDYSNKYNFADKDDDDPPMPKCPPPPPPQTILNDDLLNDDCSSSSTIIEDIDNDSPPFAIALYNFDGNEIGDLSFRENEKIYLLSQVSETWYSGRLKNGCEGIFPSNYIDIKVALKSNQIEEGAAAVLTSTIKSSIANSNLIKVLYTFIAEQPEDLTIYEDEYVNVLYKINDEWLYGEIHNKQGQFPANFIEYIPKTITYKCP